MDINKRLAAAFDSISEYVKRSRSGAEFPVLCENYYLIQKIYRESARLRGAERVCSECARYLGRNGWNCGRESFFEFFSGADFSFSEIYSIRAALGAVLLISAGEELAAHLRGERCDQHKLVSSVLSLHATDDIRAGECFEKLCKAEKILCEKVELYKENDARSKDVCRAAVIRRARRRGISEKLAAEQLCAQKGGLYAAAYGNRRGYAFFFALAAVFSALAAVTFRAYGFFAVFALPPLYLLSGMLCDRVFSRIVPPFVPLRLDAESESADARTTVVYTTLLFGAEKDAAVFDELENAYLRNRDSDAVFGVLGDLPDSKSESAPGDAATAAYAQKRIKELNQTYGDRFALFLRGRSFNDTDGIWTGRERKRGAVCALARYVLTGENVFMCCENAQSARGSRFILTLDSDTVLPLGALRELTAAAMHPANRPVVRDGRVVAGHAVFQPRMKTGLRNGRSTYFTYLRAEFGSLYDTAAYERYQSLFGRGIFCGKGLIDTEAFCAAVPGTFPEGKILSHDIPEGAVLRCMFVPDVTFTDSSPKSPVSAFLRQHRWARGDIQNLCLLGSRNIPPLGKYVVAENAVRQLAPVMAAAGVFAFAFVPGAGGYRAAVFLLLLLSHTLVPALFSFFAALFGRSYTTRRFFSHMLSAAKLIVLNVIYDVCASLENAFRSADAAFRSAWRMLVSRRKRLEWATFSQTDGRGGGLLSHISAFFASSAAGAVLAVLSPYAAFRIFGALAFLMPVVSFFVSRNVPRRTLRLDEKQREKLVSFAREQYAFFEERVSEKTCFLPPDNVQYSPAETVAERTSPTNIGLYLLCEAAACDFGFITLEKAVRDIDATLSTVEKMQKYRGHLFNWYDTRSLDVIGERYVSTVDSGNFVTMLVTLCGALRSFGGEECAGLAERAEKLIRGADFSFLYDKERSLFYLGYSPEKGASRNHYDMLMSEIRTTCYYACAAGITPKSHWETLSRSVTEKNGFVGMISWSGSAFEYFMPQLFLPSYRDSFLDETLSFAAYCQRAYRREKLWGVSESAYYCFDPDMNYQYKAHGVPSLALKEYPENEFVVSPYSAFLMLERGPEAVFRLLSHYEKLGARGEYGFYEAADVSENSVVRSYMAHHVGMSMLAAANACFDGVMRKRFFCDKRMAACADLLCESIPADVQLYKGKKPSFRREKPYFQPAARRLTGETAHPECALYKNGNLSAAATSDGRIALRCGAYDVDRTEFKAFSPVNGVTFGVICGDGAVCCLPGGNGAFSAELGENAFAFVSSDTRCPVSVKGFIPEPGGAFVFDVRTDRDRAQSVCMNFTPVLDKPASYASHPAFSRLFVVSSFLSNEKIIVFRRRGEPGGGRYPLCGVAFGDARADIAYSTSDVSLRSHSRRGVQSAFLKECDCSVGVCVEPDCTVRVPTAPRGTARFIIACGYTLRELTRAVASARKATSPPLRAPAPRTVSAAVSGCLFASGAEMSPECDSSALWKAGVSGDFPIITLEIYGKNETALKAVMQAHRSMSSAYYKSELLLLVHERAGYDMPLTLWVKETVAAGGADRLCGKRGGVFIVNASLFDERELRFVRAFSSFVCESDTEPFVRAPYSQAAVGVIRGETARLSEKTSPPSVFVSGTPPLPRAYVMSGFALGALVTEKTLGFTFYGSARDKRISAFDQDPYAPVYGEELIMRRGGNLYDLISLSASVEYRDGMARYNGSICGVNYCVKVFTHPRYPAKVINVEYDNAEPETVFCAAPQEKQTAFCADESSGAVFFAPMKHGAGITCFAVCDRKSGLFTDRTLALTGHGAGLCDAACVATVSKSATFFLGACPTRKGALNTALALKKGDVAAFAVESCEFARSFIPPQTAFTQNGICDSLYSYFAPYQTAFSRFLGRTGFYQTGGAYGFRDQLQDCLCLVYSRPDTVRAHILRCAAHQYENGGVMHWWLRNEPFTGTRTACSDDMLYLPLAVADYLEKTGDTSLLGIRVPYLSSPELTGSERFEKAVRTASRESVYMHCLRAILYCAGRTGEHGLSLMGSCDWNDGFSAVGAKGRGESVFTTFLLAYTAREFARVCASAGDKKSGSVLDTVFTRAAEAGKNSFRGDRFPRGTFDDGTFFGIKENRECAIDVICQGLAAAVLGKTEQTVSAVNAAYRELYDGEKRIFKLFSPPFDSVDAGYISAYPAGIRENGGQYTHGALWGIWGLAICGEYEKAVKLINAVTPAGHTDTEKYRLEPYVIPADIYADGRGGWSWYTGSAAWFYKIMTEVIMGIRFTENFTKIAVAPICEYTFVCERNGCRLKIISSRSAGNAPTLDGAECAFPLLLPAGEHVLRVKAPY